MTVSFIGITGIAVMFSSNEKSILSINDFETMGRAPSCISTFVGSN